jgi:predicted permease
LGGGLLGLLLASWGLDLLVALGPQQLPRAEEIAIDLPVLTFALGISLLTGILAGIVPALRFSRPDLTSPLRQASGRRIAGGLRANRLRSALVIAEVALSVVLLVGAGLTVRSFLSIMSVDTGLDAQRVLTFDISLPSYRYPDESSRLAFGDLLLERVRALPGVEQAGLTRNLPLSGRRMTAPVRVQGVPDEDLADRPHSQVSSVTPGYFRAMGIRLVDGRTFTEADDERAPPVAIVNETFARTFLPGRDPIGRRARTLFGSEEMKEIVGVVADVHHLTLTREAEPKFYQPMAQFPATGFTLVARAAPQASGLVAAVKTAVGEIDPQLPVARIASMEALLSRSVSQPRFYASMLGIFAALAVILASVGFYAVMAGSVVERRREIGIRMAVGARMSQVVRMVVREGTMITGIGLAAGMVGAFILTRLLEGLLFRVSVTDPLVFCAVPVFLALVAGLATYLPARSATRIDPMLTLRE